MKQRPMLKMKRKSGSGKTLGEMMANIIKRSVS